MTKETHSQFYSTIASCMFNYPLAEDYKNVADAIVQKYAFFKSSVGTPTGAIIQSLVYRFKEFRREEKLQTSKSETEDREDEKSFAQHNKALLTEYLKSKPNMQLAEELMTVSYSMRHSDILSNPCHMSALLEKYPFLKNETQDLFPKVLQQAVMESQQSLRRRRALKDIPNNSTNELLSLLLLSVMQHDSKCKSDSNKVLYFTKGTLDIERIVQENKQPQPYILCTGDYDDSGQCFLVADYQVNHILQLVEVGWTDTLEDRTGEGTMLPILSVYIFGSVLVVDIVHCRVDKCNGVLSFH
uniref:Uncharacterized protein n=1 Tax=Amphimedon queenslandica TaxID=400682 RepID=A0A1X7TXR6_AMPQE